MMRKVQYILVGALVLLGMACSTGSAVSPARTAPEQAGKLEARPAATTLTNIRSELVPDAKLILETSEPPAYTSYRPQSDIFVVDLPRVVKAADLAIPSNLPSFIASISAEEVLELGAPLTRVTIRFAGDVDSRISARDGAVEIGFDETGAIAETLLDEPILIEDDEIAVEDIDDVASITPVPVREASKPRVEPVVEAPATVRSARPLPSNPATVLSGIEHRGAGPALAVLLKTDGRNDYSSFTLDNPLRLVVDIKGVVNEAPRSTYQLSDPFVSRIRVAQFASNPNPVTRIVLDLEELPEYEIEDSADGLQIRFGAGQPIVVEPERASRPARPSSAVTRPTPEPIEPARTVVAESRPSAPPVAPKIDAIAAEHVIHAAQEVQPAPPRDETQTGSIRTTLRAEPVEDVFGTTASSTQTPGVQAPGTVTGGTMRQPGESVTVSGGATIYTGEPIDLNLTNADIIDVLRLFSELTGLNIAIDPGVSGTVTVDFRGVPWDQALELILRQNNLGYALEGNVMRIGTVQRLSNEAVQERQLAEEKRLNQPLNTVIKYLSYAKAGDISSILSQMLTARGKIVVDERTNQLIITDIEANLQTIFNLIDTIDIATPQVVIEARIVETTKNFARQLGITWGFSGALDPALGTGTGLSFPNTVDVIGGPFDLGAGNPVLDISLSNVLGTFNLDVLLTAAESEGLVKVVSAPRVTTQDNSSAEIQSGVQIPVQTRVNFTTTVQYIDATLRLTVTPQVTAEGTVIMQIEVQKVEPALGLTVVGGTNSPLITRRAVTTVMVRDGGTTVIGGIYQATDNDSQSRIPFLHQIPILGNLFKNTDVSRRHDELLIFITPRIVRNP